MVEANYTAVQVPVLNTHRSEGEAAPPAGTEWRHHPRSHPSEQKRWQYRHLTKRKGEADDGVT